MNDSPTTLITLGNATHADVVEDGGNVYVVYIDEFSSTNIKYVPLGG